jgi:drug/metabolite transporter, DME family
VPPPSPPGPARGRAIASVVLAAVLFGTTGTVRAKGPDGTDAVVAGMFRLAIGGPLLTLVRLVQLRRGAGSAAALRSLPRGPVLLGAVCVAVYQLGFFEGLARTGVSVGTVLAIGSGPVLAGLLAIVVLREPPDRAWAVATALAVLGAALITATGGGGGVQPLGVALVLAAGLGYAGFTMLTRWLVVRGVDGSLALGALFSLGAVLLLPFCIGRSFDWVMTWRGVAVVLWLGVGPTALAYLLFAYGLRTLSGPTATTFVLAEPVTAVLLGLVVLDERMRPLQWVGAATVLCALMVLAVAERRDAAADQVIASTW